MYIYVVINNLLCGVRIVFTKKYEINSLPNQNSASLLYIKAQRGSKLAVALFSLVVASEKS